MSNENPYKGLDRLTFLGERDGLLYSFNLGRHKFYWASHEDPLQTHDMHGYDVPEDFRDIAMFMESLPIREAYESDR